MVDAAPAQLLLDGATRAAALDALEANAAVPLATGPVLVELLTMDTTEVLQEQFDRAALLVARLIEEAGDDRARVFGEVFGNGRYAAVWHAKGNALAQLGRKPVAELSRSDAYTLACWYAHHGSMSARGWTEPFAAAGLTPEDYFSLLLSEDFAFSKARMPDEESVFRLFNFLMELLNDGGNVPPSVMAGTSCAIRDLMIISRRGVGELALEADIYAVLLAQLRSIGGPAEYTSISRGGAAAYGSTLLQTAAVIYKTESDIRPIVSSGLFEEAAAAIETIAAFGVDRLQDTDHPILCAALGLLRNCSQLPVCEQRLRSLASALAFLAEPQNDLEWFAQLGTTSGTRAAGIAAVVFGRDEGGSEFVFTEKQIDMAIRRWSDIVRAIGVGRTSKPSPELIQAVELCVSDSNKPLLLNNVSFLPYLVDALLLDPEHPRAGLKPGLKAWCQTHHVEALAQLAVHEGSREALLRDMSVLPALKVVMKDGLSEEAKELAAAALSALSDNKLTQVVDGQKHVMLSYQWSSQAAVTRLNESLIARGYVTWFDLTNMKGSTMDAMSNAIEGADVMLYGVSLKYKESANCRLEANYAHQQELDMIPLMMQENYVPKGWLGLIMGTRMWYAFWNAEQDDAAAFETRIDGVVREIGDRGKLLTPDKVSMLREPTPAPVPTPAPSPAPTTVTTSTGAPVVPDGAASAPPRISTAATPPLDPPMQLQERDDLLRQLQQITVQLANVDTSASTSMQHPQATRAQSWSQDRLEYHQQDSSLSSSQLFFLERERDRAERAEWRAERERERERAERHSETRLLAALATGTCTCGLGAAILGAWLLKKN